MVSTFLGGITDSGTIAAVLGINVTKRRDVRLVECRRRHHQ